MKSSTLASYLESLAGLIRASRPGEALPRVKAHTRPRPTIEVSGTRVVGPLPTIAMDADASAFLAECFPGLVSQSQTFNTNAEASAQDLAHQVDDLTATARNLRTMADRFAVERDAARKQVAEAHAQAVEMRRELEALKRTVDRMRTVPAVTVAPAVAPAAKPAPAPTIPAGGDFLSDIINATAQASEAVKELNTRRPTFTVQPVVLAFPPNGQGKTLSAASVTLDEVRALFAFKFLDPKDATKGGYWLARDPLKPAVHALVAELTKHGAFTRDTIPA